MTLTQGLFQSAEGLQEALDHQGTMVREVNHRAKNSLAMAIALLRLQKHRNRSLRVRQALDQAIQRLHYLARIHDILSRQQNNESGLIDMRAYLAELCDVLSVLAENVAIRFRADAVELEASRAAQVALIVGEAVTNAIKHAFPNGRGGIVRVTLCREATSVSIAVEDDGVGSNGSIRAGSSGVRLMAEMARSLGGEIIIEGNAGTRVSTTFLLSGAYNEADGAGAPAPAAARTTVVEADPGAIVFADKPCELELCEKGTFASHHH